MLLEKSKRVSPAKPIVAKNSMLIKTALFLAFLMAAVGSSTDLPQSSTVLESLRVAGFAQYRARQFAAALATYDEGQKLAAQGGDRRTQLLFLSNLMMMQLELLRYKDGAETFLRAKALAVAVGDWEGLAVLSSNAALLFNALGDRDQAVNVSRDAVEASKKVPDSPWTLQCKLRYALALAARDGYLAGASLCREVIESAKSKKNEGLRLSALEYCGGAAVFAQPQSAREMLEEAAHLRSLRKEPLSPALASSLSELARQDNNPTLARKLVTQAIADWPKSSQPFPLPHLYYQRALLAEKAGDLAASLADLREALRAGRTWREHLLPLPRMGDAANVSLQQLYQMAISIALELQRQGRGNYTEQTLQWAEENRALALRERFAPQLPEQLSLDYRSALAQWRQAQRGPASAQDSKLLTRLREEELRLGLQLPESTASEPEAAVARAKKRILSDTVLLSFILGEKNSYLWALDRYRVHVYSLPKRKDIADSVQNYRLAMAAQAKDAPAQGAALYRLLFGQLTPVERGAKHWLLSLDNILYELPVAALNSGTAAQVRYVVQDHTLQMLPGLGVWEGTTAQRPTGEWLGVGDAVYNTADARWTGNRGLFGLLPKAKSGASLARLAGSAREVNECRRAWTGPGRVLTGPEASVQGVMNGLQRRPAVVHVASHVVGEPQKPDESELVLSLSRNGEYDYLSPGQIATLRVQRALIVMSGCHSGAGKALPGAGWMGLSRAWLQAGARNVGATYWPVPDDSGLLWRRFYEGYGQNGQAAEALRAAQLAMLERRDWRAEPRYWAAFFLVGRG